MAFNLWKLEIQNESWFSWISQNEFIIHSASFFLDKFIIITWELEVSWESYAVFRAAFDLVSWGTVWKPPVLSRFLVSAGSAHTLPEHHSWIQSAAHSFPLSSSFTIKKHFLSHSSDLMTTDTFLANKTVVLLFFYSRIPGALTVVATKDLQANGMWAFILRLVLLSQRTPELRDLKWHHLPGLRQKPESQAHSRALTPFCGFSHSKLNTPKQMFCANLLGYVLPDLNGQERIAGNWVYNKAGRIMSSCCSGRKKK